MSDVAAPRGPLHPLRFLLAFTVSSLALYAAYMALPDAVLREVVYPHLLGHPAVQLINLIEPAEGVVSAADRLFGPYASLQIVRGCDGAGVAVLLLGALLAFPAPRRDRALAALGATLFVYLLNELRVVVLYFAAAHAPGWFTLLHAYVLPGLLVMACASYFLLWSGRLDTGGVR